MTDARTVHELVVEAVTAEGRVPIGAGSMLAKIKIRERFRARLEAIHGLTSELEEVKDRLWDLAWRERKSEGYRQVAEFYDEVAWFLK